MRKFAGVIRAAAGGILGCALLFPRGVLAENETNAAANDALLDYKFTNELGQPSAISDFRGQVVAITFFFTRCPMPEFCPRLSKNFQEAARELAAHGGAFTNWHFLSITFDPAFDTPEVLQAYAERYEYDPRHWSFLTGPAAQIGALARLAGVKADPDHGLINHNFRTLIVAPSGRVQTVFPMGGNLSESIVQEMRKAAAASAPSKI